MNSASDLEPNSFVVPEPNIVPTGASRKIIDEAGARIAKRYGFKPEANFHDFVQNALEGNVDVAEPDERIKFGYLRVPGAANSKFDIILSPYTGDLHDRFTMAHELGHYFLHYLLQKRTDSLIIHREGTNRAESEANWFAEGFLMPSEEFQSEWERCDGYMPDMINRFRVASDLIANRKRTLDRMNSDPASDGLPNEVK
jgi:predicted transcriptional regulator